MSAAPGPGPGGGAGAGAGGGGDVVTLTVVRDDNGYGMKVSGDNPVYVQSVKERGAAWRAGVRAGDTILAVNQLPVPHHTHLHVVQLIRASPTAVLTVQQNNGSRQKTPITAPQPVDSEKQRQLEFAKVHTIRLMLDNELKHLDALRGEVLKVPDVRKQAEIEATEQRCAKLQHQIDIITSSLPGGGSGLESPRLTRPKPAEKATSPGTASFLSGLPRSLSNLTGQSLRNLRQARAKLDPDKTPLNNCVSPNTTCLDALSPPPLPPRSTDRQKRNPLSPNSTPKPYNSSLNSTPLITSPTAASPTAFTSPILLKDNSTHNLNLNPTSKKVQNSPKWHKEHWNSSNKKMNQQHSVDKPYLSQKSASSPPYRQDRPSYRRSAQSLDLSKEELNGQPNSIAMQMSYPLVATQPPVQMEGDNRSSVPPALPLPLPVHARTRSSPEQLLDPYCDEKRQWDRVSPPPGTPPPPYPANTQPCADPQRAIISMEDDDSASESIYSGLFSNLRSVRESKARTAVLINWLLGERRCACANLLLLITEGFRCAEGVAAGTLRRWAYEIHSSFLVPNAALAINGVDENMARDIDEVLLNEACMEEKLRCVFRKARQKAKEELVRQLSEFQVKRQVGLGTLYGPPDDVLLRCDQDRAQEAIVVEQLLRGRISALAAAAAAGAQGAGAGGAGVEAASCGGDSGLLLPALLAAAHTLQMRPEHIKAALGSHATPGPGPRPAFLQREKHYKQRLKQLGKQTPQPLLYRGHHLWLHALTQVSHCHHCQLCIGGLAPQAYLCASCELLVHVQCARRVDEPCCCAHHQHAPAPPGPAAHTNRISRLMDRIHHNAGSQDNSDKKSRKTSSNNMFLNMERAARRNEEEGGAVLGGALGLSAGGGELLNNNQERKNASEESLYESAECSDVTEEKQEDPVNLEGSTNSELDPKETSTCRNGNPFKEPLKASPNDNVKTKMNKKLAMSKESLIADEGDKKTKKGHRKTMSLSNPLEMVKNLGDEWFEAAKREMEKTSEKMKSRESLASEDDFQAKTEKAKLDKTKSTESSKSRKSNKSVSALNLFRRRKPTATAFKTVEAVAETIEKFLPIDRSIACTKFFLEAEKLHTSICLPEEKIKDESEKENESDAEDIKVDNRRRLSRTASRTKMSKNRGKSQTVKVNPLKKSQSGTLKRAKKKNVRTPVAGRSRQASVAEGTPMPANKTQEAKQQSYWLFGGSRGESKRDVNSEDTSTSADAECTDTPTDGAANKDRLSVSGGAASEEGGGGSGAGGGAGGRAGGGRAVGRAESCRERATAAAGQQPQLARKHKQPRNASDPNRLTHNHSDVLESAAGGATPGAPSGSSSSSSLSSRSNDSAAQNQQNASQSEWSEEEEGLGEQWASTVPASLLDQLPTRLRKRQEVIHELIVSEASHVRWLKVLECVFLRPLQRAQLLPAEELRALFPNLPEVRERHARLHVRLRALRAHDAHLVPLQPLAHAILTTLGEGGYAACLSRFCSGQRMALDALRERRRKSKELHGFLVGKEQSPRCTRLQLKDLLACVWQRLTKYQLLLESILRTVEEAAGEEDAAPAEGPPEGQGQGQAEGQTEGEGEAWRDSAEGVRELRRALHVAKDVLHTVDTAIRQAENEHRLRTIQSKLEVRVGGAGGGGAGAGWAASDGDEMRRLDLTQHTLLTEGELLVRTHDAGKPARTPLLALMLTDCLVLLQREGDKFILKPIMQPSHQAAHQLSPIIKWSTVLFRPNAAVKNTFFLMNINGVQMHELSVHTATEYNTWTRYIMQAPLAEARGRQPTPTQYPPAGAGAAPASPSPSPSPSPAGHAPSPAGHAHTPPAGGGVSRNGSDASRTSASTTPEDELHDARQDGRDDSTADTDTDTALDRREKCGVAVSAGRISVHRGGAAAAGDGDGQGEDGGEGEGALESPRAVIVTDTPTPLVPTTVTSLEERMRLAEAEVTRALRRQAELTRTALRMPPPPPPPPAPDPAAIASASAREPADDLRALLHAATLQAGLLTEALSAALGSAAGGAAGRGAACAGAGLCARCHAAATTLRARRHKRYTIDNSSISDTSAIYTAIAPSRSSAASAPAESEADKEKTVEKEISFDMLSELDCEGDDTSGSVGACERDGDRVIVMEEIGESSTDPPTPTAAAAPAHAPAGAERCRCEVGLAGRDGGARLALQCLGGMGALRGALADMTRALHAHDAHRRRRAHRRDQHHAHLLPSAASHHHTIHEGEGSSGEEGALRVCADPHTLTPAEPFYEDIDTLEEQGAGGG